MFYTFSLIKMGEINLSEEAITKFFISIVKPEQWIYDPNKRVTNEKDKKRMWDALRLKLQSYGIYSIGKLLF